jgi:phage-related protein (TIGR01555 family)
MGTYNFEKKSAEEQSRIPHSDGFVKSDGWINVLTGLGMRGRDKNVNAHFRLERIFEQAELDQLYRSDGVTRRIMDIVPAEMVRQGWEIEGDSGQDINRKMESIRTNFNLITLLRWARLYGGALCVMGIADGLPLEEPVDERNIRDIKWLHVFDRYQSFSRDGTFEKDLNSPNYGYPNVYTVNDTRTGALFYVHHSRILRVDWSLLPPRQQNFNNGWGDPLIQSIYDELRNYSTAFANAGLIMQDFVNYTLSIPNLAELIASQCADNQVMKRLDLLNLTKGATNTMILDAEEKYEKASTNISGIPELLDRFMLALSAVSGIPTSLLFGRSAAGLNATGDNDVRNFYDMVKQEQENKLKPVLEKLTRYIMLSKDGPFAGIEPDNWSVQFVPLWQNTEEQEAIVRKIVAETDAIYLDRGVLDPAEVAVSRFGGNRWSMNTEVDLEGRKGGFDPEEIEELEQEKKSQGSPPPGIGPYFMPTGIRYRSTV